MHLKPILFKKNIIFVKEKKICSLVLYSKNKIKILNVTLVLPLIFNVFEAFFIYKKIIFEKNIFLTWFNFDYFVNHRINIIKSFRFRTRTNRLKFWP